jgi:FMN phosphatase YigB (HAD superfamily)
MTKKNVSVLITDLDNTLYDWFEVWHTSFKAMLNEVVKKSGISEDVLIPEIKKVHELHGTSEYLMLLNEIPCLKEKHPKEDILKIYKDAIEIYKTKRTETLKLYPTVLTTLNEIKRKGCLIVGYTDSQTLYSAFRFKELGLDGIFDFLYSAPNHDFDAGEHSETNHFFPSENNTLKETIHRDTPKDASKPNPEVLISIIEDIGVSSHEVVYLGDSLLNDISMAQAVPVTDVFAKYGEFDKTTEKYELLRKVTHWKAEKVSHEKDIAENKKEVQKKDIIPTIELNKSFAEILDLFEFVKFETKLKESKEKQASLTVEIWKKTIEVQQHFNDLELRIRNYAFTILGIIISASAVAYKEYDTSYLSWVLVLVGLILWGMFFLMDYLWYHQLLIGSVKHGIEIENTWSYHIPTLGLTKSISVESKVKLKNWTFSSSKRMKIFYGGIAILLLALFGFFLWNWWSRKPPVEKTSTPSVMVINNSQSPINTNVVNSSNSVSTNTNSNAVNSVSNSNSQHKEKVSNTND